MRINVAALSGALNRCCLRVSCARIAVRLAVAAAYRVIFHRADFRNLTADPANIACAACTIWEKTERTGSTSNCRKAAAVLT